MNTDSEKLKLRREKASEWRANNPDKVRAHRRKHYTNLSPEQRETLRDYNMDAMRKWRSRNAGARVIRSGIAKLEKFNGGQRRRKEILELHRRGKDVADIVIRLRIPASVVLSVINGTL